MTCPDCNAEAIDTDGGGEATWTRFACGNVAEYVKGSGPHYTDTCERRIIPGSPTEKDTMSTSTTNKQIVELDFAGFIAKLNEPGEWGPMSTPPKTIEEYVAGEAVSGLEFVARTATERAVEEFTKGLGETIEAMIKEQVAARIEERMTKPFQPMKYGEPVGDPITLLDLIDTTIEKECQIHEPRQGYTSRSDTTLMKVLSNEVGHTLTADLKKHAEKAREVVVTTMQERGAAIIAQNLVKLAADERLK